MPATAYFGGCLEAAIRASGPAVLRAAGNLEIATLRTVIPSGKSGRFVKADVTHLLPYTAEKDSRQYFGKVHNFAVKDEELLRTLLCKSATAR